MTTTVTVRISRIKYYDHTTNSAQQFDHVGRVSIPEAKKLVKEIHEENVLINKENINDTFEVSTTELYSLKGL